MDLLSEEGETSVIRTVPLGDAIQFIAIGVMLSGLALVLVGLIGYLLGQ